MKVVVVGAAGMLGRDVVAAAQARGHQVVAFTRAELDLLDDRDSVEAVVASQSPDAVVNCAAWTDVDGAEAEESAAHATNAVAAGLLAAAAAAAGASIVYPSTDYVFDGAASRPYVESDPVGPQTAYGRTKLAGERATAAANERHFIVRTSWLFGTGGKNFVDTMLVLADTHDHLRVVDDQIGCPTSSLHLAAAIVELVETDLYGIHHLAGGGECSWYEFAVEIFRQAGAEVTVAPCTSRAYPRPAPRPAYSVLGRARSGALELPHWHVGLANHLAERAAVA